MNILKQGGVSSYYLIYLLLQSVHLKCLWLSFNLILTTIYCSNEMCLCNLLKILVRAYLFFLGISWIGWGKAKHTLLHIIIKR